MTTFDHTLPHVYIAGPYTRPDPVQNTHRAIQIGMGLYTSGFAYPVIPHVTLITHLVCPQPAEFWYEFDYHSLSRCDAVYRFPGESTGADAEVALAEKLDIPVFTTEYHLRMFCLSYQRARLNEPGTLTEV